MRIWPESDASRAARGRPAGRWEGRSGPRRGAGALFAGCLLAALEVIGALAPARPDIVLVMADDMGWGETSYASHPVLKTPHLDEMAAAGLRFERFYAGAPVCSPTRATVLTGRTNDRTGVRDHGFPLRRQERTLPRALREAGYATGHFGKWHLNGVRGAGVPVLAVDARHPGEFGFDVWLSATNYIDRDPILGGKDGFAALAGDSSEAIVAQALEFIAVCRREGRPSFTVIWYGSPHHPARAASADTVEFAALETTSRHHYGELVALDRSVGTLRAGLRRLGGADQTLVWFCSDNGGLGDITPGTVGGLRDCKGSLYEGGLRVPAIIEWPAGIARPRITKYPACTMDIFPTVAALTGLPSTAMLQPLDGLNLQPLFAGEIGARASPIPFRYLGGSALVDNRYKLVSRRTGKGTFGRFELYDLENDPHEEHDLAATRPKLMQRLLERQERISASIDASAEGRDYPAGRLDPDDRQGPRAWTTAPEYQPYLPELLLRPEYRRIAEALRSR